MSVTNEDRDLARDIVALVCRVGAQSAGTVAALLATYREQHHHEGTMAEIRTARSAERSPPKLGIVICGSGVRVDHARLASALVALSTDALIVQEKPKLPELDFKVMKAAITDEINDGKLIELEKPKEPWRRGRPLRQ